MSLQKNSVAVAYVKRGKGEIRLNGAPLDLLQPEAMRWKVMEPVLLLGKQRFANVDIRLRVKGGGRVSQIYALRQAIAKGLVAFYQKCAKYDCSVDLSSTYFVRCMLFTGRSCSMIYLI